MEFYLHYRGRLKGNARPSEKHSLRQHFHKQLKELWSQKPLSDYAIDPSTEDFTNQESSFVRKIGSFVFVPLINESMNLIAELEIILLRPEPPGAIITQSGDIDNRLKTLFNALRIPHSPTEYLKLDAPKPDEIPFFCLLEDDNLIQHVSIRTDRLLEPADNSLEVELLIRVRSKITRATMENLGLGV